MGRLLPVVITMTRKMLIFPISLWVKKKEEKLSLKRRDLINGSESRAFLEMGQQAEDSFLVLWLMMLLS
jgi:hypothetical protein